ncbi:MAG: Maf family protein [Gemmataceae bacterium]
MAGSLPFRLILASSSPARRDLLTRAGFSFDVQPSHIDEPDGLGCTDPRAFVQQLAWLKAAAVAPTVKEGLVLAADTVGWLAGQVIGKPNDEADARRILRQLGGREHQLWTGVCLWRQPDGIQTAWQEVSRVHFKKLSEAELNEYLATRQWEGCSGAYAIQEDGDPFVKVIEGSASNIIGLPMETLERVLEGERRA